MCSLKLNVLPSIFLTWLQSYWSQFKRGVSASLNKINATSGLMVVTKTADWQRCCQGGENIAANAILYHLLDSAYPMAAAVGDAAAASSYAAKALALKAAINTHLWDADFGAFKDNPTSTLHPQVCYILCVPLHFFCANPAHYLTRSPYMVPFSCSTRRTGTPSPRGSGW